MAMLPGTPPIFSYPPVNPFVHSSPTFKCWASLVSFSFSSRIFFFFFFFLHRWKVWFWIWRFSLSNLWSTSDHWRSIIRSVWVDREALYSSSSSPVPSSHRRCLLHIRRYFLEPPPWLHFVPPLPGQWNPGDPSQQRPRTLAGCSNHHCRWCTVSLSLLFFCPVRFISLSRSILM